MHEREAGDVWWLAFRRRPVEPKGVTAASQSSEPSFVTRCQLFPSPSTSPSPSTDCNMRQTCFRPEDPRASIKMKDNDATQSSFSENLAPPLDRRHDSAGSLPRGPNGRADNPYEGEEAVRTL